MRAHRKVKARSAKTKGKASRPRAAKAAQQPAAKARSEERPRRRTVAAPERIEPPEFEEIVETEGADLLHEREMHAETSPNLSGGDVDADWQRAYSAGDEGVGGSVPTPDQDVVDEIGRAFGLEQPSDAEVRTAREIFEVRRRLYWHLARKAESEDQR